MKEKISKKEKKKPVMKIGLHRFITIALWILFICGFAFAIYKNFTAIDTHTEHEKTVVEQKVGYYLKLVLYLMD